MSGKEAELWHADTGEIEPVEFSIEDGRTTVQLHLNQRESVFVVFRHASTSLSRTLPTKTATTLTTIAGRWILKFPPNLGAPAQIMLDKLESWNANSDDGVKYFSGTATYTTTVQVESRWIRQDDKVFLNLGGVNDLAEVTINGRPLGILWKSPYQVDVTNAIRPGANQLEIKVTNEWTNRLIGDRSAPPEKRVLSTTLPAAGGPGAPQILSDSGLLGPVRLVSISTKT